MTARLHILSAGPGLTTQDLGRPGWTTQGLPTGGAVDRLAVLEAAALHGASCDFAVIEMMGFGGTFQTSSDIRIALTGAMMRADIDGDTLLHNATHRLRPGQTLTIAAAEQGVFGYLAIAGGIVSEPILGSRSAHLTAGIGHLIKAGDRLPIGADPAPSNPLLALAASTRFDGGSIRVMPGPQTDFFTKRTRDQFCAAEFHRSSRGNRQGVRLDHEGPGFATSGQLNIISDMIGPGDIQLTGDGVPYVLLAECQTIGGYPRIGTVIPQDLPKIAQAAPGTPLRFRFITVDEADASAVSDAQILRSLKSLCLPQVRNPHDIADLLSYQLIDGATPGDDLERP